MGRISALAGWETLDLFGQLQRRMLAVSALFLPFFHSGGRMPPKAFLHAADRREQRLIPAPYIESDAELHDRLAAESALRAHQALAAALETDLLMMRLRGVGK